MGTTIFKRKDHRGRPLKYKTVDDLRTFLEKNNASSVQIGGAFYKLDYEYERSCANIMNVKPLVFDVYR